jgi:hypothetical protein
MWSERRLQAVEYWHGSVGAVSEPTPADLVAHVVALPTEEARALRDVLVGTCTWSADTGPWQSVCGVVFVFEDGCGPEENGVRYCHGCGSRVVVTP